MSSCSGCGGPIETEHDIIVVERVNESGLWTYRFHGWRCLGDFMIKRKMVVVDLHAVGPDEAD